MGAIIYPPTFAIMEEINIDSTPKWNCRMNNIAKQKNNMDVMMETYNNTFSAPTPLITDMKILANMPVEKKIKHNSDMLWLTSTTFFPNQSSYTLSATSSMKIPRKIKGTNIFKYLLTAFLIHALSPELW